MREGKLRESIAVHQKTVEDLNRNSVISVSQIRAVFAQIRANVDKRENELLGEAEAVRMQKEKELKLHQEGVEMFAEGMRSSGEFTKSLVDKGSQVEIAMSKKAVMSRLSTLNTVKIDLTPCHDSTLRFTESGLESLNRAISQFGSVSGNQTSHTTSYIERQGRGTTSLNEEVSFKIISMNKEGERIPRGGDHYLVHIDGPSKIEVCLSCFLYT